jgi:UDP-glucose 4-epimerase
MRVVVFGGTGFVGLNIAEALLAAGDDVVVFDQSPPPAAFTADVAQHPGKLEVVTADVRDPAAVADALAAAAAAVYGAAVTPDAARESADPRRVLEVNLMGWLGVLEGARRHGLGRLINLSSASAYGGSAFGDGPLDEAATAPDPIALYAVSKVAGERLGDRLRTLWGLDVVNVRLSAVFGPWERATGVRDTLSPPFQIVRALLAGEAVRLEREDVRDWVYAPDVARAVHALLHAEALTFELYNIGPGRLWSLTDWARHVADRHAPGLEVALEPQRATIASHMPRPRQPLAVERLRTVMDVETMADLAASADHYAAWAVRHRDVVLG